MRFGDQNHVDTYYKTGKFPEIHQQIASLISEANEPEGFIDVGACTGLLAVQAISIGRNRGLCIEGNPAYYLNAVTHEAIRWFPMYINSVTMPYIATEIAEFKPTLAICRRVLPEIEESCMGAVATLGSVFWATGIKKIILQGRVQVEKPVARYYSLEKEIEAFPRYKVVQKVGQCCLLVRKD